MTVQIIDCEQNSEEWLRARMGIPTASEFKTVIAVNKEAKDKKTRTTYMHKLAGEILTGQPHESYSNANMERGHELEDEARSLYAFVRDAEPTRVGFIRSGNAGCSPDSLVNADGMLEIKTAFPHILIDRLLRDDFPAEHKAQCQGQLWIAEREWVDLAVYWPGLPLFVKRAFRDEPYIKDMAKAVDAFNAELQDVVNRVRALGQTPLAA